MAKYFLGVFCLFVFLLVSATWTLSVVVPKEMAQDHVSQGKTDMSSREANPLPFINMLTGLLIQSQAQAEGMAGSGGKLWGQG